VSNSRVEMNTANVEQGVIGSILIDNSLLNEIDLTPDNFAMGYCRILFQAMVELHQLKQPIDLLTLDLHVQKTQNKDLMTEIGQYGRNTPSAANGKAYAQKVKSYWRNREACRIAYELSQINTTDNEESIDTAIRDLMQLNTTAKIHNHHISTSLTEAITEIEVALNKEGQYTGLATGIIDLDRVIGGLHDTDLIIIGARPAMGKTALLLNMFIRTEAMRPGICSSEQGHVQMAMRMISIDGRVNGSRMRAAELDDEEWALIGNSIGRLRDKNIWVNDKPGMSISDIERQARQWVHDYDVNIIGVDYLQKIKHESKTMPAHERIGDIAIRLKDLAKELNVPVVALAQVNRKVEDRADKRPHMSDIKDSGVVEQEADQVMTIYRDDVYETETEPTGLAEINIEKNRHGPLGRIDTKWLGKYMQFNNLPSKGDAA
jgi:replicative DNA helicase